MYETRRTHFDNRDAHLQYIRLFYQVDKQIPEVLNPVQVQLDTAVQIDSSSQPIWYIIEERDGADITRGERDIKKPLAQQLLGKIENDEIDLGKTLIGQGLEKSLLLKASTFMLFKKVLKDILNYFQGTKG